MKQWFRAHSKVAVFCFSLAAQLAMHLPFLFVFSFCDYFIRDTYYNLAMIASMITGIATILMLVAYFERWSSNSTFWMPLSFLVHHRLLVLIHIGILEYKHYAMLPYEWEKYTKIIGELYAYPFAIITLIGVMIYRLMKTIKERT